MKSTNHGQPETNQQESLQLITPEHMEVIRRRSAQLVAEAKSDGYGIGKLIAMWAEERARREMLEDLVNQALRALGETSLSLYQLQAYTIEQLNKLIRGEHASEINLSTTGKEDQSLTR